MLERRFYMSTGIKESFGEKTYVIRASLRIT